MRRILTALLLVVAVALPRAAQQTRSAEPRPGEPQPPARIVSLVPAASEMLFGMGAGDQIRGVGSYDQVPEHYRRLARVGGLLDPDVEQILSLRPDLVVVYATQDPLIERLSRAGVPLYTYKHRDLADVTDTMRSLGRRVGRGREANEMADSIERRLSSIRAAVARRPRPNTLLVFGREPGTLRSIRASGGFGFLHDLLETAGGLDTMRDVRRESVEMSTEMVLTRAPEVIIELRYGKAANSERPEDQLRAWRTLPSLPAVRSNRVYLLAGDEFVVPGPRVADVAERFARVLHPGVIP